MAKTKQCSQCGLIKSAEQMVKNAHNPDGLGDKCKECNREWHRLYKKVSKARAEGELIENVTGKGIDSMTQVDSVLREMSELQFRINTEKKLLNDRIAMLQEYTENIIEADLCHQLSLRIMLKNYFHKLRKNGSKIEQDFRFGSIRISRKRFNIELRPALAGKLMGRP